VKGEAEFRRFLLEQARGRATKEPYTAKVASDIMSRCRRLERVLGIELSPMTVGSDQAFETIKETLVNQKLELDSASRTKIRSHSEMLYAVRLYREFVSDRRVTD